MEIVKFFATQCVRFLETFAVAWVIVYLLDRICRFRLANRLRHAGDPWLGLIAVACLSAGIAAGISWVRHPLPSVHDEFSYLMAADTFSHGRLTNPTHPMWQHFETLHVIQQPTYASKYPPGHGLILAIGQVAAGDPMVGLWLSIGLAAAATTWMLHGWTPGRWALLGGVLVALHPGIQLIWTQGYWGGNVAFIGGALVLGAYARLRRTVRCRDAVWMALGLSILANSRPFEGAVASLPVAVAMLFWLMGPVRRQCSPHAPREDRTANRIFLRVRWVGVQASACHWRLFRPQTQPKGCTPARRLRCVVLPLVAALSITAAWMAYYNWRVTGNPWKMPYMVHEETYGAAPFFLWQPAGRIPEYRHAEIARLHGWLRDTYLYQRTWAGFVGEKWVALVNLWHFFLGIALSIPLLALPWMVHNRRYWLPVAMVCAGWAALLMTTWANPHYFAPAAPALLLLVVQGFRHLRVRASRWALRRSLVVRALVLAQLIGFVPYTWFHVCQSAGEFAGRRAELVSRLQASPGRHLVIVRYGPDCSIHQEWVHNGADIDAARIVWARQMNPTADRQLVEYFRERHAWLLRADEAPPQLVPYEEATQPDS
jgi:hypothetical protein